jgi:energy-coupling factor transporter transmembrane protein EcfT
MSPNFEAAEVRAAHKFHMRGTAIMVFAIYFLVILTYQDFFLFNPAVGETLAREISLWICLAGWIIATIGSPLIILGIANGKKFAMRIFPYAALIWPFSIIVAQIILYIENQRTYLNYIFDYPIFVITDIALPIFLMIKWNRVRRDILRSGYELY